jgi:hypothetical protein
MIVSALYSLPMRVRALRFSEVFATLSQTRVEIMTRTNFLHIDLHARTGGRANFVIDELSRVPGSCAHVEDPLPPIQIAGPPFAEISDQLNRCLGEAYEMTKAGVRKEIRVTQRVLLAGVASYPVAMPETCASLAERRKYRAWRARAAKFFLDLARAHNAICSIVAHHDETFPHIHAVLIPTDTAMLAPALHPGYAAREAVEQECLRQGMPKKEAVAAGRRAYAPAMRQFQDAYHEQVGHPSGHARLVTGRARLPRGEYLALRTCHDARDQAILDREQAERERAAILTETTRLVEMSRQASEDVIATSFAAGMRAVRDGRIEDIAYNPVDHVADLIRGPDVDDVEWEQLLNDLAPAWDQGLLAALEALLATRSRSPAIRQEGAYF